jgi:hypothetical protein
MNRIGTFVLVGVVAAGSLYAAPALHATIEPAKTVTDPGVALTSEQMQLQADEMLSRMQSEVQHARQVRATARASKDSIKLSCINHSLIVAEQLTNVGADGVLSLKTAARAGNHDAQVAQFKRVAQVAEECDEAHKAIGDCLGTADVSLAGSSTASVQINGPKFIDNPIHDCNALGLQGCVSQPLEYVAFSSPFLPD